MARANLDALVITSSAVGQWFTSFREPHEWHDICQSRSAWYILTHTGDYLYMTPTAGGEHFNTTRRSTWVTNIRSIVERSVSPRHEIWDIHDQVVDVFRAGLTEREFLARLDERFRERFDQPYSYEPAGSWDVRNPRTNDSNFFHSVITDRVFREGDLLSRSNSGVTYRGYRGDVDRVWYIGQPPDIVRHWYRAAWECNRAMAELIRPGTRCSEMWAACDRVEQKYGLPRRRTGRVGHGYRNTGGLSVHPDNHTPLEPGMVISVEPMFGNEYSWYDLEDQYVVTETGAQALNPLAPEELPLVAT